MVKRKTFVAFVLAVGSALLICFMPLTARGAMIQGTITGTSVMATVGSDLITSKTINMSYFTTCYFITNGVASGGFGGYNFVFAGQGVASGIANISPSDFTISQYKPWVGSNNAATNFVTGPDSANYNRNVTNQDDGGADIVISYAPKNAGDPARVNFLQAYVLNTNNAGFTKGTIDNGGVGGPFYNEGGVSGTGKVNRTGTIPLVSAANRPAWLVDIPYTPGDGYSPPYKHDTITSETDLFQTFISSQRVIDGKTYNVLYGGVQWGYTFTTVDTPEPATVTLFASGLLAFGGLHFSRRRRTKSTN
jgi:PEP-CTERM motif